MNKNIKKAVINQQVLERLNSGDEFLQEVQEEMKPSRIDSRRQKAEQHEQRKAKKRAFNDYH